MKIAFYTLGCKVNQYETEALKEQFSAGGWEMAEPEDFAQVYVINTCTVTGLADRKSRQYIRRMKKKNPEAVIAVTGCYAQVNPEAVGAIKGVNIVAGTNEKGRLKEYIEEYLTGGKDELRIITEKTEVSADVHGEPEFHIKPWDELTAYEETGIITSMESRSRAYIKIQEGCDRFCSYCVIPYARGGVRSRGLEEILTEAEALLTAGFKELILTGINTALYGTEAGFTFPNGQGEEMITGVEIIISRLNSLDGDFRIRLSSLEPTVINAAYVKRLLKYEKLCHHLHLSLQSGSSRILNAMNRNYEPREYLDIVEVLKEHDKDFGITTDIIAGFPGETGKDFEDSLRMVETVGFCKVHAFKYSKRPGTAAAEMAGHISPEIKTKRVTELIETGERAAKSFCRQNIGTVRVVLFEEEDPKTGYLSGYADNYIRVYAEPPEQGFQWVGNFYKVLATEVYRDGVKGLVMI